MPDSTTRPSPGTVIRIVVANSTIEYDGLVMDADEPEPTVRVMQGEKKGEYLRVTEWVEGGDTGFMAYQEDCEPGQPANSRAFFEFKEYRDDGRVGGVYRVNSTDMGAPTFEVRSMPSASRSKYGGKIMATDLARLLYFAIDRPDLVDLDPGCFDNELGDQWEPRQGEEEAAEGDTLQLKLPDEEDEILTKVMGVLRNGDLIVTSGERAWRVSAYQDFGGSKFDPKWSAGPSFLKQVGRDHT